MDIFLFKTSNVEYSIYKIEKMLSEEFQYINYSHIEVSQEDKEKILELFLMHYSHFKCHAVERKLGSVDIVSNNIVLSTIIDYISDKFVPENFYLTDLNDFILGKKYSDLSYSIKSRIKDLVINIEVLDSNSSEREIKFYKNSVQKMGFNSGIVAETKPQTMFRLPNNSTALIKENIESISKLNNSLGQWVYESLIHIVMKDGTNKYLNYGRVDEYTHEYYGRYKDRDKDFEKLNEYLNVISI